MRSRDWATAGSFWQTWPSSSGDGHGPATLLFFDLDGFKRYNDTYGHAVGDALLVRLGSALSAVIDDHGSAYRLGGDEFCALLEGRHPAHDQLVASARTALTEHGGGFDVTTSLGVTLIPEEASTADEALRLADERMYADKGTTSSRRRKARRADANCPSPSARPGCSTTRAA